MAVEEMPSHTHLPADWDIVMSQGMNTGKYAAMPGDDFDSANNQRNKQANESISTGGNQAHNIVQPSMAVYGWRRTA